MSNPTTPFSWQMPVASDLVTDLPADFEVFGQAVATSMQDLLGGTTGQVLAKTSATDMDFTWTTPQVGDITAVTVTSPITGGGTSGSVGIAIQDALTTQKGAVQLSDSTSTTSSILAATPTAVKSAYDLANSTQRPLPYTTNSYYASPSPAIRGSTTYAANTTYYTPIFVRENRTFNRIAIATTPTFSGTASVRLGIYNITSGVPSTVVLDAGLVAPIAATTVYEITISQALTPGWYWLAANTVTAATTNSIFSYTASGISNSADMGYTNPTSNATIGYTQSVNASAGFATASSPAISSAALVALTLRA